MLCKFSGFLMVNALLVVGLITGCDDEVQFPPESIAVVEMKGERISKLLKFFRTNAQRDPLSINEFEKFCIDMDFKNLLYEFRSPNERALVWRLSNTDGRIMEREPVINKNGSSVQFFISNEFSLEYTL